MGEKFWHLQPKSGMILRGYVKSINVLNEIVDYAYLDDPLFAILLNLESRQIFKNTLLDTYYPQTKLYIRVCFYEQLSNLLKSIGSRIYIGVN